jgi:hypothetical protein
MLIDGPTGFIQTPLQRDYHDEFMNAIKKLKQRGMTKLVIDLR